jgi:hypothetical protein
MAGTRQPKEVDLAHLNAEPTEYQDGGLGLHMPFDMPVYVKAFRLMSDTREHDPKAKVFSQGLKGHTLEIDAFTYGVKVYVRIGTDGNLKVIVEDSDGRETLAEYNK